MTDTVNRRINIGVSSCLLGQEVRFDGGHKRSSYINDMLGQFFDFTPYCPEMAIGLGVPRPTIRLIERNGLTRLVDSRNDSLDHTDSMTSAAQDYCRQLAPEISGYIVKNRSPSCGMERVNLFNEQNMPEKRGVGIFTAQLMALNPLLPVEEEGRLNDATLRENFIERLFVFDRWQQLVAAGVTASALEAFHRMHKFILLAHDEASYRELGPLIAGMDRNNPQPTADRFIEGLMSGLAKPASRGGHLNVLHHIMGFMKKDLGGEDKQELLDLFQRYHRGETPLIVPLTLLNHFLRKHPKPYINEQYYLNPYPAELMLRNHV